MPSKKTSREHTRKPAVMPGDVETDAFRGLVQSLEVGEWFDIEVATLPERLKAVISKLKQYGGVQVLHDEHFDRAGVRRVIRLK